MFPALDHNGDLPLGVHAESISYLVVDFSSSSSQQQSVGVRNDRELRVTMDRIRRFQEQLLHPRSVETDPVMYRQSAAGFIAELDRMQLKVREYFGQPAPSAL